MEEFEVRYYVCEHCGKKFDDRDACIEHEKSHVKTFEDISNYELASVLEDIASRGTMYRFGETILGMPLKTFDNALSEAAKRLAKGTNDAG